MKKVCQNMTFRSGIWQYYDIDFEVIFKCMSGATTENGKFIMPLKEKLSYNDSSHRCNSEGFAINLNLIKIWIQGKKVLAQQKIAWTNSRESFQDSDYKFNFPKTRMNKNSWTLLLLITQTGSEFNFKIMKSGAMMNFGVSLNQDTILEILGTSHFHQSTVFADYLSVLIGSIDFFFKILINSDFYNNSRSNNSRK